MKQVNGEAIYTQLTEDLNAFAWAFASTITERFGVMTDEEIARLNEDIVADINTDNFQNQFRLNQVVAIKKLIINAQSALDTLNEGRE
ncbi:MAG: hypothetical protein JHC33_07735 [Ignisphaera sp.]|nr:hypothetical protein [Ignisphaera sp.]